MTVLVFGKTGQVATHLQRDADVLALGRDAADLSDPTACAALILAHRPLAVINAAAYTAVDRAEEDEPLALTLNGGAPTAMAQACAALDIPFVTLSSDYVFGGAGNAHRGPDAPTGPLSAYGRSKLAGEAGVRAAGGRFVILRTSWVFSAYGQNFVKTMLRLGAQRDRLSIVDDQIGGPTGAADIAKACLRIVDALARDPRRAGTYHFSGVPDVSWADFAEVIFKQADMPCTVCRIASSDYPTAAVRPRNSRLDCATTKSTFGLAQPNWQTSLSHVLADLNKGI